MNRCVHRIGFIPFTPSAGLSLAFSDAGDRLAVGKANGEIEIWKCSPSVMRPLSLEMTIPCYSSVTESVRNVCWLSSGALVTSGWDGIITVWNLATLTAASQSNSYGGPVWSMTSMGALVAAGCEDGSVRIFDASNADDLRYVKSVASGDNRILSVEWGPGGRLAFGNSVGRVQVVHYETGDEISSFSVCGKRFESPVWAIAIADNGDVVTGDSLGTVQFWDVATGTQLHAFKLHEAAVVGLAQQGNTILASGIDTKVQLFSHVSNEVGWTPGVSVRAHALDCKAISISPQLTVSTGIDGSLRLYNMDQFAAKSHSMVDFLPQSPQICLASSSRIILSRQLHSVMLWRIGRAAPFSTSAGSRPEQASTLQISRQYQPLIEIQPKTSLTLTCSALTDNGELIMLGSRAGLRMYILEMLLDGKARIEPVSLPQSIGDIFAISATFSQDNNNLCLATAAGSIMVISTQLWEVQSKHAHHKGAHVRAMTTSQDSNQIASADSNGLVVIHHIKTGKTTKVPALNAPISCLRFHESSGQLFIGTLTDGLYVYNLRTHTMASDVVPSLPQSFQVLGISFLKKNFAMVYSRNRLVSFQMGKSKAYPNVASKRYQNIMFCECLGNDELVLVEMNEALSQLAHPLKRSVFIL